MPIAKINVSKKPHSVNHGNFVDRVGIKYGRLTVLRTAGKTNGGQYKWLCKCDCGNSKIAAGTDMLLGNTRSCGCLKIERVSTHGMSHFPEYKVWSKMKHRCRTKNGCDWLNYGSRGIKVCKRWSKSFRNFLEDMGRRPAGLTIERINNNGDYCPRNCKWATYKEQMGNRRSVHLIRFKGETKNLTEWAESLGIKRTTLSRRISRGLSIEKSFNL